MKLSLHRSRVTFLIKHRNKILIEKCRSLSGVVSIKASFVSDWNFIWPFSLWEQSVIKIPFVKHKLLHHFKSTTLITSTTSTMTTATRTTTTTTTTTKSRAVVSKMTTSTKPKLKIYQIFSMMTFQLQHIQLWFYSISNLGL